MARTKSTRNESPEELKQLALLADAIGGLTHALNNHLNGVVLQAAALQLRVPEEFREGLERIRKEGTQAAHLFRPLQWVRQQARQTFHDVDVSAIAQQVIKGESPSLWQLLSKAPVLIPGAESEFRRMFQYLFEAVQEYRDDQTEGTVLLEKAPTPMVELTFSLKDAAAQESLSRLGASQEQDLSLHFLAIRSLVRLLEGRIEVEFPDNQAQVRLLW